MQPGMGLDLQHLVLQAQKLQDDMARAQQQLAEAEVTGTAGGGLVTATVNGAGELLALEIKPEAVDPSDTETLADLIVAAVRDAKRSADELAEDTMGDATSGFGGLAGSFGLPGLPG